MSQVVNEEEVVTINGDENEPPSSKNISTSIGYFIDMKFILSERNNERLAKDF